MTSVVYQLIKIQHNSKHLSMHRKVVCSLAKLNIYSNDEMEIGLQGSIYILSCDINSVRVLGYSFDLSATPI